jgi:hypothetical protein
MELLQCYTVLCGFEIFLRARYAHLRRFNGFANSLAGL